VLNILTEHDFQDAFKNGKSSGDGAYALKGSTSGVMVARRPRVGFGRDGSTSPGNYGCLTVTYEIRTARRLPFHHSLFDDAYAWNM
jgi:hypothetical protein